jgi:PAS domain S-box-containing protein
MSKKRKSSPQPRTRKTTYLKYVGHGGDQERATLLEQILDAFVSVDSQWRFTYVNHHAEALLGKTQEELLGRNVWEVFPIPADSVLYRNAHEALEKQTGLVFQQFHPLLNKWFDIRLYPFQDGLYSFCQDITERKKAEEQLQFQADTPWEASKSIIVTDLQGKIIYWNEGASRLFGYTSEEMLGQTPALLYPRFEREQLGYDLEQIRNGRDYTGLWKGRRKDGTTVWVDIKTTMLRDSQGKMIGYIGTAQDTKERKQEGEHFLYYAQIAQNSLDAVIATDTNYNILSWNEAAERLYGWKQEEVVGKFVDDILFTEFFSTTGLEASEQLLSRGYWKGKVIQKRKDGIPLTIQASVSVIKDASGKMVGAIAANRELHNLTA